MQQRAKIGLALGGGGARGSAHVGVLRVLEREGIPVDVVAGTSVGALVGGAYAAGLPLDEIERIFSYVRWRDLLRWTWPRDGLFDNSPLVRSFERVVGRVDMAALRIPFAAMATDVEAGQGVAIRSGSLAEAVRASTAIPFFIRPVQYQGQRLVDGGVLHKVPVGLARELGADIVIAVDVGYPSFEGGPARNLVQTLLQIIDIMDRRLVEGELSQADLVLKPRVHGGSFNFRGYPPLVRAGEEAARELLPELRWRLNRAQYEQGREMV